MIFNSSLVGVLLLVILNVSLCAEVEEDLVMSTVLEGQDLKEFNVMRDKAYEYQRNGDYGIAAKKFREAGIFYSEALLRQSGGLMASSFLEKERAHVEAVHTALEEFIAETSQRAHPQE
eukprot:jgi/Bigna1/128154/aug1.6_g2862